MTTENKAKRVRTGCRTCRERHLKCDEGEPDCNNCLKSNRECKKGIELRFTHSNNKSSKEFTFSTEGLKLRFEDCSRRIADEYIGGYEYPPIPTPPRETTPLQYPVRSGSQNHTNPSDFAISLPPIQQAMTYANNDQASRHDSEYRRESRHSYNDSEGAYLTAPSTSYGNNSPVGSHTSKSILTQIILDEKICVTIPEEALLMQLYMEEVALWMDSMDPFKHFSEILPHDALHKPMLYQSLLACGARHYTLVNPSYPEDKALSYYHKATTLLLRALQNPDRDTVCCATTAVCLNVYEIMSEKPMQRMNHIAGARALIKECGWNAKSEGIGAACFWLNVGMEVLSCLHFNWQPAWNPDLWGIDMNFEPETRPGKEEFWAQRMLYIVGKVSGHRARMSPKKKDGDQEESRPDQLRHEQLLHESRTIEWRTLLDLCERWDACKPMTMRELIRVDDPKSCFVQVNLTGRASHIGQLFYHTAMCLLAQTNPQFYPDKYDPEMAEMRSSHGHDICSIVAHSQDRGIASAAIRCLAIGAECLTDRREQEEVLEVFKKTREQTGWRVDFISDELKEKWQWPKPMEAEQLLQPQHGISQSSLGTWISQSSHVQPPIALPPMISILPQQPRPQMPSGIKNPMYRDTEPYKAHYIPPTRKNYHPQDYQNNYQ